MTTMCARRPAILLVVVAATTGLTPGALPAADNANQPLALTSKLLLLGLDLLDPKLLELNARLKVSASLQGVATVNVDVQVGSVQQQEDEIDERLKTETNAELRQRLQLERDRLEMDKRRNELLADQNRTLSGILYQQFQAFEYQKQRDEGVLRKAKYTVPPISSSWSWRTSPAATPTRDEKSPMKLPPTLRNWPGTASMSAF